MLSHASAAALHGLPIIGDWPERPHCTAGISAGGRSSANVVRHSAPFREGDVVEVGGLLVTSVARTLLDLAVSADLVSAVASLDHALFVDSRGRRLTLLTRDGLLECYARRMPFRGHVRARAVVEFGETGAQTPIESASRESMWEAGAPRPVLQQPFYDHLGLIGDTDFDFPSHGMVGEADGDLKYLDARFRGGRCAEQVVLDEKRREDRLRAIGGVCGRLGPVGRGARAHASRRRANPPAMRAAEGPEIAARPPPSNPARPAEYRGWIRHADRDTPGLQQWRECGKLV